MFLEKFQMAFETPSPFYGKNVNVFMGKMLKYFVPEFMTTNTKFVPFWLSILNADAYIKNKLAKARKTRKSPGTLGLKKVWAG